MHRLDNLRQNMESVFFGRSEVVTQVLVGLVARGHVLIEDVPGVGKTVLARSLARSVNCDFNRIQLTPDMLPSDILGVSIYNQEARTFEFKRGPIFANIVLADEINRTTPRTQSSLLEAMNDSSVTIDGKTMALPAPFMVIATQNPFEFEGTYLLPENQLDRFLLRVSLGYPQARTGKGNSAASTGAAQTGQSRAGDDHGGCAGAAGAGAAGEGGGVLDGLSDGHCGGQS